MRTNMVREVDNLSSQSVCKVLHIFAPVGDHALHLIVHVLHIREGGDLKTSRKHVSIGGQKVDPSATKPRCTDLQHEKVTNEKASASWNLQSLGLLRLAALRLSIPNFGWRLLATRID